MDTLFGGHDVIKQINVLTVRDISVINTFLILSRVELIVVVGCLPQNSQ